MEDEAACLPEGCAPSSSTPHSSESAFTFDPNEFTSDGHGIFVAAGGGGINHHNKVYGGGSVSSQWTPFIGDFPALLHVPGLGSLGDLDMDRLADHSHGSSGSQTPDRATQGWTSHGSSPPPPRWSSGHKPLGVQGVLMTTQIINVVESVLANKPQSLDVLLGTIQKAGRALNGVIGLHHHGENMRCLILFSMVLHQVADLVEAGVEILEALNCERAATSSSILDRLDSLNDLISSYQCHAATAAPQGDEDKVRRWTRRLEEELDASLVTVQRLVMGLEQAECGNGHGKRNAGGRAHLEALAERFHLLRRRL